MPTIHGSHWKREKDKISREYESEGGQGDSWGGRGEKEREKTNMRGQDGQDGGWTDSENKERVIVKPGNREISRNSQRYP